MEVVDAEPHHIAQFITGDVRQVDIDEWVLGTGMRWQDLLTKRLDLETQHVRALLNDGGKCIALWGAVDDGGIGCLWLIASTEAERVGRRIHRFWPNELGLLHMRHSHLAALAYEHNELHLKWLGQIGFVATSRHLLGPGGVPFILYQRHNECAHLLH